MANEALAAGAAAEAAKGQVIPVEDSLPYGRDTMETMEMDGDAENLNGEVQFCRRCLGS